jgi:hypothetical protein
VLITLVLVLLIGAGGVVWWAHRGARGHPSVTPSSSAPSLDMVLEPPTCSPEIVESGYTNVFGEVRYGLILRNPCADASVWNHIAVTILDPAGNKINDDKYGTGLAISVLLPGQKVGIAGYAGLTDTKAPVGSLRATVDMNRLLPATVFARWTTSVTGTDLAVDRHPHDTEVTFSVRTAPPNAPLCDPQAALIIRDKQGKILSAYERPVDGGFFSMRFSYPPVTDDTKFETYIRQGGPGIGVGASGIAASLACLA